MWQSDALKRGELGGDSGEGGRGIRECGVTDLHGVGRQAGRKQFPASGSQGRVGAAFGGGGILQRGELGLEVGQLLFVDRE